MLEEKAKDCEDKFIIFPSQFCRAFFKKSLTFLVKLCLYYWSYTPQKYIRPTFCLLLVKKYSFSCAEAPFSSDYTALPTWKIFPSQIANIFVDVLPSLVIHSVTTKWPVVGCLSNIGWEGDTNVIVNTDFQVPGYIVFLDIFHSPLSSLPSSMPWKVEW